MIPHRTLVIIILILISGCAPPREVVNVSDDGPVIEQEVAPVERDTLRPPLEEERVREPSAPAPRSSADIPRFHGGRMWTFHNPPLDYLEDEYSFRPDSTWLNNARRGALRFSSYCSASFVSPNGLILTNHHCARQSISSVTGIEEGLLDDGFYAATASEERRVPDLYVEELVSMENVTEKVFAAARDVRGAGPKAEARQKRADAIERRRNADLATVDSTQRAEVVELHSGVEYWVYTYRKYKDVRLVMAPELELGYFGGDTDNFTYPRYTLDFSFFRVYGGDGEPLSPSSYFSWGDDGISMNEPVFTVGNPGSTTRLNTVEMLNYIRDVQMPASLDVLTERRAILAEFVDARPVATDSFDLRNDLMSLENTIKSQRGQFDGLREGEIIRIREAVLAQVQNRINQSDSLRSLYGSVVSDIALLQQSKRASSRKAAAFTHFLNPVASSHILTRGMYGYVYTLLRQRGAPADQLEEIRKEASGIKDWPRDLEKRLIALRLRDLQTSLGADDPSIKKLLGGASPAALADSMVAVTAIADSAGFMALLDDNYLASDDVTVEVLNAVAPLYFTLDQQLSSFGQREQLLLGRLARAQFAVLGGEQSPDATFTLRFSDGRIRGYDYNGTRAPDFTTFYGMYDHAYSYPGQRDWTLPARWQSIPSDLDLSTPLNLVSTNDITGGNSGSPLITRDLEIVGLAFDGNMESLPNEFLFRDRTARTISVDVRAISAVLGAVYSADRVLQELLTGNFVEVDAEAEKASGE